MGWSIQHLPGRTEHRSYGAVYDALRDLAEAADTAARSGRPWRWS